MVVLVKVRTNGLHGDQSEGVSANHDISITNSYNNNCQQNHFLPSGNGDAMTDEKDAKKEEEKKDEENKIQSYQNLLKLFLSLAFHF